MLLYAEYVVQSIDGDYAHLLRTDLSSGDDGEGVPKLVARALLPPEITEGTELVYEGMQYFLRES